MDATLIFLLVALIVVIVLFAVALRAGRGGGSAQADDHRQRQGQGQQQAPERPASAAPRARDGQGNGGERVPLPRYSAQDSGQGLERPGQQIDPRGETPTRVTTTTTTAREVPSIVSDRDRVGAVVAGPSQPLVDVSHASEATGAAGADVLVTPVQAPRPGLHADDRMIVRGVPVVEAGVAHTAVAGTDTAAASTGGAAATGGADSVRFVADVPRATVGAEAAPRAEATVQTADVFTPREALRSRTASLGATLARPDGALAPDSFDGLTTAVPSSATAPPDGSLAPASMELVGQPPTRSGAVILSVTPGRLPYRVAELLGEQRSLEEAITIAHRRIDDVELGPDPGSAESRVQLAVLRQDLTQKQERLREILFLQDGYRWVQQQMAPGRAPGES